MTTTSGSRFSPPRRVEAGCYRTPVISTSRSLPWRLCTRADCHLFDLADAGGYGVDWVGWALVMEGVNSKRTSQSEATAWPSTLAGAKSQRCAACRGCAAKYLLGPGEKSSAEETLATGSTWSLTVTRTVSRMVAGAPLHTVRISCSRTLTVA